MNWFRLVTRSKKIYPKSYDPMYYENVFKSIVSNNRKVRVELPERYDVSREYTRSNGNTEPTILNGGWALHRKSHVKSNGLVVILPNEFRRIREWTIEFKVRFNKVRPMSSLIDFGDWSMGFAILNNKIANYCQRNGETLYHDNELHEVILTSEKVTDQDLIDRYTYYRTTLYVDGVGKVFMDDYVEMPDQLKFLSTDDKVSFRDMDGYIDDIFIADSGNVMDDEKYEYKPSKKFLIESYPDGLVFFDASDEGKWDNSIKLDEYLEANQFICYAKTGGYDLAGNGFEVLGRNRIEIDDNSLTVEIENKNDLDGNGINIEAKTSSDLDGNGFTTE